MKKFIKLAVVLAMALAIVLSVTVCASAESYNHTVTVNTVTEEIIGGVMTGNKVVTGTTTAIIGTVDCDIPDLAWYRYRVGPQAKTYTVTSHGFKNSSVWWYATSEYYSQLYVYMGSNSPTGTTVKITNSYQTAK